MGRLSLRMLQWLVLGFLCAAGVGALTWEVVPRDFVFACNGGQVTFPWNVKLAEPNETVLSVNWIHADSVSSRLVAASVHKHFMVASLLEYSGRVRRVGDFGLTVDDLTADDSGNYTLEVKALLARPYSAHLYRSFSSTAYLQVGEGLKGRELRVERDSEAWWDPTLHQWMIRLTCGSFDFKQTPPVDVVWTLPGGHTQGSTGYASGRFYLALYAPVLGGDYSCSIPSVYLPSVCQRQQDGGQALTSSHVTVDELSARLSMLEANEKTLLENNADMQDRVQRLEHIHEEGLKNETECCQNKLRDLLHEMDLVEGVQLSISEMINNFTLSGNCKPENHKIINDAWRSTREGEGRLHCDKSMRAGWYRFYLHGANAVIPTKCVPQSKCQTHASTWVDLQGKSLPAVGAEVDARACSHWSSDCCNWQVPITVRNCGRFFVYKITPVRNCQLAFCVEPQET